MRRAVLCSVLLVAFASAASSARQPSSAAHEQAGRAILKELIETNTTHSTGNVTTAAERMSARLIAAGFPKEDVQIVGTVEKKRNLVARYRGTGTRKPVLFIAHLDVVEAKREDWSFDPFVLNEKDGYYYGRGTLDVKGGAATLVAAFVRLRQEKWAPDRDLILALTADEEGGPNNGIAWLIANRRDLITAEYCINFDSGGPELHGGKVTALEVQAAEKVYQSFTLTVKNAGGHSSLPRKDNAIYRLAAGLGKLSAYEFPVRLNEVTRSYFDRMAPLSGADAADMRAVAGKVTNAAAATRLSGKSPFYNALLRTTCVPTLLQGGHAENALPQAAVATVNCRMLPDEDPAVVKRTIERVVADPQIAVAAIAPATPSPSSPLVPEVFQAIAGAVRATYGRDIPLVPYMETGATDGLLLRNAKVPVYGTNGIAFDPDDVRAHGKDERILVRSFNEGLEFAYQLGRLSGTLKRDSHR
jgi:acetylornithine deacetylase/succinyl-diaminopimelate desuccinylase-like protein